jgi:hypothetical protein
MTDRELRLLRAVADNLRAILQGIRSISDQYERQNTREQPPAPSPVIRAEVQIPEGIQRNNQANSNRDHRDQLWLIWGTWLAFIAAAIYAGISRYQLSEIQKQTTVAEQQSRPWIKVTEVKLNSTGTLCFNDRMILAPGETLMMYRPIINPIARADIRTEFHLKNIGRSVPQDIRIVAELFLFPTKHL